MMRKRFLFIIVVALATTVGTVIVMKDTALAPFGTPAASNTRTLQSQKPAFDKTAHSTTDATSIWVIVNKQHPLAPLDYVPADLTPVGNGQYLRAEAAQALATMFADANSAGFTVTAQSGYRSYATQVAVYNNEVKAYGQAVADSESARPGYSEHQSGWAVDLGSGGCNITDCFGTTPGGVWITANAYKYGFILRYPAGLSNITGYRTESWHFRYVGIPLATEMHKDNVATLEQFFNVSGGITYN